MYGKLNHYVIKIVNNAKVGIVSLSYAVILSFLVSVLFINPYFIFKFIIFNILVIIITG